MIFPWFTQFRAAKGLSRARRVPGRTSSARGLGPAISSSRKWHAESVRRPAKLISINSWAQCACCRPKNGSASAGLTIVGKHNSTAGGRLIRRLPGIENAVRRGGRFVEIRDAALRVLLRSNRFIGHDRERPSSAIGFRTCLLVGFLRLRNVGRWSLTVRVRSWAVPPFVRSWKHVLDVLGDGIGFRELRLKLMLSFGRACVWSLSLGSHNFVPSIITGV